MIKLKTMAIGLTALALVFGGTLNTNASLPESAADIVAANPDAPDGVYAIYPNGQMFDVYCYDMAGTPKEYLELIYLGSGFNFGQYTAGGASPGTSVRTNYEKVRLDPATLLVDIGDQTFATSTGSLPHGPTQVTSMPYGVAMSCVSPYNAAGIANIDLRGTPFNVVDTFVVGGYLPAGDATFSSDYQVVDITGGGYCGWNTPHPYMYDPFNAQGGFHLDLGYIGPWQVTIDIKPGSYPNSINNNGHGVIPVAILSSIGFDATEVDPSTCSLDGQTVRVRGKNSLAHIEDVDGDGLDDLVIQIENSDDTYEEGDWDAVLTFETFDGTPYWGTDSIRIVP